MGGIVLNNYCQLVVRKTDSLLRPADRWTCAASLLTGDRGKQIIKGQKSNVKLEKTDYKGLH